jgi:superfamily II DNA or RNA helicase
MNELENALSRGVKGRIITSTYQNFTDIASLNIFLELMKKYKNFDCHLEMESFSGSGFHTKGYLFVFKDTYEMIIGSTNITRFALLKNIEWNISILQNEKSIAYLEIVSEFSELWQATARLSPNIIKEYATLIEYSIEKWDMDYFNDFIDIRPNYMQKKALKELRRYRDQGVTRALVVAATGSGKTHLAAFDARNFGATKLLFVVHRENILIEAMKIFASIFGSNYSYGLFTGNSKSIDSDFLFATNVMMHNNLNLFDKKEYNYIVVDEVHHAAAASYRSIINYFQPEFLLGLTATPDRMDNQSVYEIFDKNIPFDLRLRDAIINDLVVPFQYYGIRDALVNYGEIDAYKLIKDISKNENCDFISAEIQKHKPNGKLKAVAFCMSVEHARQMSENMRLLGYSTISLTGNNQIGERIKAFQDLQDDQHTLEIIFTVDILNEGVDIPAINMVLFLRPTESSIVFLQQLGRGLRKYLNKPYLTVLDFIGNSYKRSVQIIQALGTLTRSTVIEKKLLIDLVSDNFKSLDIPGVTINFDKLSKEEIIEFIRNTNFNVRNYLESDYKNFKRFINSSTYPSHMDYLNNDFAPDLIRFMKSRLGGKKNISYYNFLLQIGEEVPLFSDTEIKFIDYISNMLPLIRHYEFSIIQLLLQNDQLSELQLIELIKQSHPMFEDEQFHNSLLNLQCELISEAEKLIVSPYIVLNNGSYKLTINKSDIEYVKFIEDIISYGLLRFDEEFGDFEGDFKLYGNYTTEQFMMAKCEKTYSYYKGTKIEKDGTVYILANLKKEESQLEHLKYHDSFISNSVFQWESETNTTMNNHRGLIGSKIAHLLIRKTSQEDGITLPFTYIGTGHLKKPRVSTNTKNSLLFDIELDHQIPTYLEFDFSINNQEKTNEKTN